MTDDAPPADEVPFYLMPLAAIAGTAALVSLIRAVHHVYRVVRHDPSSSSSEADAETPAETEAKAKAKAKLDAPQPLTSVKFLTTLLVLAVSVVSYAFLVARVNDAMAAADIRHFDPYDTLNIPHSTTNSTLIKRAYFDLSKKHHPDKPGGSAEIFHGIEAAYRALADEVGHANYVKYGHPDGRPGSTTLAFALPQWLLHPKGTTAAVLLILYLGLFVLLIKFVLGYARSATEEAHKTMMQNSVDQADVEYLEKRLVEGADTLDQMDILFLVSTTPETLMAARMSLGEAEDKREEKRTALAEGGGGDGEKDAFAIDDGGWADDDGEDEEDEAAKARKIAAKKEEYEKKLAARQLAASTGKLPPENVLEIKMEGVDDGVLGQTWVEGVLRGAGAWPPKNIPSLNASWGMDTIDEDSPASSGKGGADGDAEMSSAVALQMMGAPTRRNLLLLVGRLHSQLLNAHPDLVRANRLGLIDRFYFKHSVEYRQRTGLLLEASLRVAMKARSYRLAKTIIEAVAMFKIGTTSATDPKNVAWFNSVMERQYGGPAGLPRLSITEKSIDTPGEDEVATGDTTALSLTVERLHAGRFFESKIALCKRQGMDPRMALQTYHEGWWVLVRAIRLGPLAGETDDDDKAAAGGGDGDGDDDDGAERLAMAWPFIVRAIAQKTGKIRCQFKAPDRPGRYRFLVDVKSQEFLGADTTFEIECDVLDAEVVKRMEQEESGEGGEGEGEGNEDDEGKKDK